MQYIHHMIRGNAKQYYNSCVKSVSKDHTTVVTLKDNQYNYISRRNRIEIYLNGLRNLQFINAKTNVSDALENLYAKISQFAPQGTLHCRLPGNKVAYLRKAVIGHSFASEPISSAAARGYEYQELLSKLESSIQLEREQKSAQMLLNPLAKIASRNGSDAEPIFFQGQANYGKDKFQHRVHFKDEDVGCFNCGSKSHGITHSKEDLDATAVSARKVQFYAKRKFKNENKALKRVVFELFEELNESDCE